MVAKDDLKAVKMVYEYQICTTLDMVADHVDCGTVPQTAKAAA